MTYISFKRFISEDESYPKNRIIIVVLSIITVGIIAWDVVLSCKVANLSADGGKWETAVPQKYKIN